MDARWFLPILVSVLSLTNIAAEDRPLLGVEVGSGLTWGSAGELVFDPGTNRMENDPVSLLNWPVSPSYQLALTTTMDWLPWIVTSVSVRGAWPLVTGTMTDEDWRAQTDSGFLVYGRSQSVSYLTNHWSVSAEQTLRWSGASVGLGGLYKTTSWEAWDGSSRYEYATGVTESLYSGLVLEYRQVWYIPYLSAQWTGEWEGWTLTPSARLSPYTWCFDTDNHMFAGKRVTYLDNLRGGWYAKVGMELTLPPFEGLIAGLRGSWETATGAVGDTWEVKPDSAQLGVTVDPTFSANSAGGWFQEASVSLFVRN